MKPQMRNGLLLLMACLFTAATYGKEGPPNIVFMLADNLGYGDIGAYGGGELRGAPTPRIDALAAQGLRLTNFNVEPECTPSRSALMTGRMPVRSGTSSVPLPGLPQGLTPWEYTLAELLHDAGYATALYGKWHLGDSEGRYPTDQGFDEWWGIPRSSGETLNELQAGWSADLAPPQPIMEGVRGEPSRAVGVYDYAARPLLDGEVARKSAAYIRRAARSDTPFFLLVSFTQPHAPAIPGPDFDDPQRTGYQDVLVELDHHTGMILDALDAAGISDNTVVVWASDNGPETHQGPGVQYGAGGDPGPFRGEFPSAWEGAIRVPGILRWPGQIPQGAVSNEIVSILDFYRTLARVAGADHRVPSDRPVDSIDQLDFFTGKQATSNRDHVMFFYEQDLLALKWRRFKAHFIVKETGQGTVRMPGQGTLTAYSRKLNKPWVFDVANDPKELWNIAPSNVWLGEATTPILAAYQRSLRQYPNIRPGAPAPQ